METTSQSLEQAPMIDLRVDEQTARLIAERRGRVTRAIVSINQLLTISGACALGEEVDILEREAIQLEKFEEEEEGVTVLNRLCPYKPRTDEKSWKGQETTNPELTAEILTRHASARANVALEIVLNEHIARYKDIASFAWFGARNTDSREMFIDLALAAPNLSIGKKNALDGSIDEALEDIEAVNRLRDTEVAVAVLIFRGGENAKDPDAWEKAYREAHKATNGLVIVDLAHGGEMAHTKGFKKSVGGQILALGHLTQLIAEGIRPSGIMLEASDTKRLVDPNMPFSEGISGTRSLLGALHQ